MARKTRRSAAICGRPASQQCGMSRGLNAKAEWVTFLAGTTTGANATQIGIVATKVGLSVDAIRFYERNALMPPLART